MSIANVSGVIKSIQDIMRKDAGVDGDAHRIGQLVWMFFLKILDDKEQELITLAEVNGEDYTSPMPSRLRWCNWAADAEGITGDTLLNFINNDLFPTLKELQANGKEKARATVIRNVFEDAYNYMKSGTLIRQAINKLNEIDFNNTDDQHTFGDIYEQLLKDLQSAGNAGEFYTPRAVTQFMVEMVAPRLHETVLDPACGTGGFLTHTIDFKADSDELKGKDIETLQKSVFGVEKKALPHLLATTNMMLHGIDVPNNISHDNTLKRPLKDYGKKDQVDIILSNPPFGGMEEDGIEGNFGSFKTRETADLFLVLIMRLLKKNGRAAVVLPDGTLFGEGIKTRIKEKLLSECDLHTIVRLPKGVFNPYTNIKTNLLFFNKGKPTTEIWYYEHPYPEGYKSYSKTKPMRIDEFEAEKKWWNKRVENEHAWRVSIDEIKARGYNLDIDNPNLVDEGPGDPAKLLAAYQANQQQVKTIQNNLKAILEAAIK